MTTLNDALRVFDTTEANLGRLEKIWTKIEAAIPDGIAFYGGSPEGRAYADLVRTYKDIRDALPSIDGWKIAGAPLDLDEIAQERLDAREIEMEVPAASVRIERMIFQLVRIFRSIATVSIESGESL